MEDKAGNLRSEALEKALEKLSAELSQEPISPERVTALASAIQVLTEAECNNW